jgi:hypothetical protein
MRQLCCPGRRMDSLAVAEQGSFAAKRSPYSFLHHRCPVAFCSFFLTNRRHFCHNTHERNEQTATNETRWHHLRPAGAGFLRKYFASRRRGRVTSEKAKNIERKLNYEKSENYIYDGPVCSCLLWALPTSAKRHRHTRSRCEALKQHGGWDKCSSEYHDRSLQFGIWVRRGPIGQRRQL